MKMLVNTKENNYDFISTGFYPIVFWYGFNVYLRLSTYSNLERGFLFSGHSVYRQCARSWHSLIRYRLGREIQMSKPIQKSKLIHAELKCGSNFKYVWLGNDNFAKLFESWDYESNEGKFEGMLDFDQKVSYFFDREDLKRSKDLIGIDVEDGLEGGEIVDFEMEDIDWEVFDE